MSGTSGKATERSRRLPSEVGSSSREKSHPRVPAISRIEVDNVSRQIAQLGKQIDQLKKMPDLPKYDGAKDPQEHLAAFDLVMNLYGQSGPINAKLFVTTLTGKAQEWFTNLPLGSIESHEQLVQKFTFHFANMMVSILIHGLKKGPLASALARDPPADIEQLMNLAQKYIDEEEMNAMKDGEWKIDKEQGRDRVRYYKEEDKRPKHDRGKEPPYLPKYHKYTPLNMTRAKALLMVEKKDVLKLSKHTRFTPAKKFSNKYCRFHREKKVTILRTVTSSKTRSRG
ncbi:UNVERIFIED_CONTAM: hypothetical protein Sindi_0822800 [Sesamum indicum]